MSGSFAEPGGDTALDAITLWLVNGLALLRTYGLFSFMFGVGPEFLMGSRHDPRAEGCSWQKASAETAVRGAR